MKLCFNEATCMENSTLERDIYLAQQCGYQYIEIRLDMLRAWQAEHALGALADLFAGGDLRPWGYNSLEDITFCDAAAWRQKRADLAFAAEAAQVVGGHCVVVVPTMGVGKSIAPQAVIDDSVRRLRELSDYAGEQGLRLAFEPIGNRGCCVPSLEMAQDIVDRVDRENVGLAIDAFNLFLNDGWRDPGRLRQVPVEKIYVYHINDADNLPIDTLDHCHRLFPGNGIIPLARITQELVALGYDGPCSLELFNPGYWQMDARDVFEIGAQRTRCFLA